MSTAETNSSHSVTEGSLFREADKDTCRSGGELLTGLLPRPAQLPQLDNPGPRARGATTHSELDLPTLTSSQEKCTSLAAVQLDGNSFLVKVPFSQVTIICIKVTKVIGTPGVH